MRFYSLSRQNHRKHRQQQYSHKTRFPCKFLTNFHTSNTGQDIFALDRVLFPINVNYLHWVCAVIFIQERRIQFYDSLGSDGEIYLRHLLRFLQDAHVEKRKEPLPDIDKWRLIPCREDTPRQRNSKLVVVSGIGCYEVAVLEDAHCLTHQTELSNNITGYDCGIFTCMFVDFLSMGLELTFGPQHMETLRKRIALTILTSELNPSYVDLTGDDEEDSDGESMEAYDYGDEPLHDEQGEEDGDIEDGSDDDDQSDEEEEQERLGNEGALVSDSEQGD